MSRRRQLEEPVVHGYWPHSDPEPPPAVASNPVAKREAPAEDPCPGQCNRAFRLAEEAGEPHDIVMHPGRPVWCVDVPTVNHKGEITGIEHHGCTQRIQSDLAALLNLAVDLAPGPLNTPRDVNAGSSSSARDSQPTASPGWDTADELIRWALHLEDQLRERLGHPHAEQPLVLHIKVKVPRPFPSTRGKPWILPVWEGQTVPVKRVPPPRTLHGAIRYLSAYSTALLSGPDAEIVGRQVMRRKRQLEQGTGQDRLVHRLPGSCMVCDRKGLQRKDGGDLVKCRHCGATWAWEHYERLAKAYADDVRRRGA